MFVAVLTTAPDASGPAHVPFDGLRRAWQGGELRRLGLGAAEFTMEAMPIGLGAMREEWGLRGVDVNVVPEQDRRKRLLLADMDSTMIGQECVDELAAEAGVGALVAAITARAMNGEIGFEGALRERVALLEGLEVAVIDHVLDRRITPMGGARTLLATMRAEGAHAALVSGGFTAFTGPVAAMLGFHEHRANVLEVVEGRLTGRVREPILGREAKVAALEEIAARLVVPESGAIAVGDGANDLDMLARAGMGVALHAKPAVRARAALRIDHGDLTALLYLQGYRRDEFR